MEVVLIFLFLFTLMWSFRQIAIKPYAIAVTGLLLGVYIFQQVVLFDNGHPERWQRAVHVFIIVMLFTVYIIYVLVQWSIAWRNKKLNNTKEANAIKYGMIWSVILLSATILLSFFLS